MNTYLSKNPITPVDTTISDNQWTQIAVTVTIGEGGSFFIDGELVHQFSQQDAQIPQGDLAVTIVLNPEMIVMNYS